MKNVVNALLLSIVIVSSTFAQFDEGAIFGLLGYSNQELVLIAPPSEEVVISELGAVANILRIYEDQLFIVHSGDYANNGAGAEIWYATMDAIENAYLNSTVVNWNILDVEDGSNPWDVFVTGSTAFVSLTNSNSVKVFNLETNEELAEITDLSNPQGLIADDAQVMVMESGFGYGDRVTLINIEDYSINAQITVGQNPQYAIVDENDCFHIVCSGRSWESVSGSVYKYNPETSSTESVEFSGNPGEIALITDSEGNSKIILGDEWAVTTPHVYAYNPQDLSVELDESIPNWGGASIASIPGFGFVLGSTTDNRVHEFAFDYTNAEYFFQASNAVADLVYYEGTNSADTKYAELPEQVTLSPAWPNPFNAATSIEYTLKYNSRIDLSVYDLMGRKVKTLDDGTVEAGTHKLSFNAGNLSSGTYFIQLQTENISLTRKIMLVK